MIDGTKLAKYLYTTGLKVQEFWFLFAVMNCENNNKHGVHLIPNHVDNEEFNKHIAHYFANQSPDIKSDMKWSDVAFALEEDDWVAIHQTKKAPLKLENCKVTDKFTGYFMVSDREQAFLEFYEKYPKIMIVNDRKIMTLNKSKEDLAELYYTKILKNGNALLHERCLLVTEEYIRQNDNKAPYIIENYFTRYEAIAEAIESGEMNEKNNSGRQAF